MSSDSEAEDGPLAPVGLRMPFGEVSEEVEGPRQVSRARQRSARRH
jgi:hypothetical protein